MLVASGAVQAILVAILAESGTNGCTPLGAWPLPGLQASAQAPPALGIKTLAISGKFALLSYPITHFSLKLF